MFNFTDNKKLDKVYQGHDWNGIIEPDYSNYTKRYKDVNKIIIEPKIKNLGGILSNINLPEEEANKIRYKLAILYEEKEDDGALSLLKTVERSPSEYQLDAQFRLGMLFFKKGILNIAEEYFNKIIETDKSMYTKVNFLYQIGTSFEERGLLEKAPVARQCSARSKLQKVIH